MEIADGPCTTVSSCYLPLRMKPYKAISVRVRVLWLHPLRRRRMYRRRIVSLQPITLILTLRLQVQPSYYVT